MIGKRSEVFGGPKGIPVLQLIASSSVSTNGARKGSTHESVPCTRMIAGWTVRGVSFLVDGMQAEMRSGKGTIPRASSPKRLHHGCQEASHASMQSCLYLTFK